MPIPDSSYKEFADIVYNVESLKAQANDTDPVVVNDIIFDTTTQKQFQVLATEDNTQNACRPWRQQLSLLETDTNQDKEGDMKSRSKWLFISLFILILGGVGMVILYQQRAKEEAELIRHEQERMALYAYNNFEGVEKVEFTSFEENIMTGTWDSEVVINGEYHVILTLWGFGGDITVSKGRNDKGDYLRPKNPESNVSSLKSVNIIYWKGN
ncbi:hypothetical protein [Streptococcus sp. DD13]|uniref:hypothetical protein n=1 Tax=Streptococcus sp. DD13 TaxID=1777881 RepID=UPI00079976D9|nr:hypothetical protein [Streptococcus sp. DD13]KXT78415.1 hypothetical protein STRDD13_00718 [Streptococcus sp. DD13]